MKERIFKFKFDILALLPCLFVILGVVFMIMGILAFSDPRAFDPTDLTNKEKLILAQDPYYLVGSYQNIVSFTFGIIGLAFFILFALDLFFRNMSSHVLLVTLADLVLVAYYICRSVYCFNAGGLNVAGGFFNAIAAGLCACLLYYYPLKALDGDCRRGYMIVWIASFVFGLFGSVSTYNLLDFHKNLGNIIYWGGYASTRFMLILSVINVATNYTKDFDPDPLVLDAYKNKSDKVLGK